jgi:hypothetical protein
MKKQKPVKTSQQLDLNLVAKQAEISAMQAEVAKIEKMAKTMKQVEALIKNFPDIAVSIAAPESLEGEIVKGEIFVKGARGRWFIQKGFAGFDLALNKGKGYKNKLSAQNAVRRLNA